MSRSDIDKGRSGTVGYFRRRLQRCYRSVCHSTLGGYCTVLGPRGRRGVVVRTRVSRVNFRIACVSRGNLVCVERYNKISYTYVSKSLMRVGTCSNAVMGNVVNGHPVRVRGPRRETGIPRLRRL